MIEKLFDSGAMPALERVVQFTETRHRVLADNIANLSTPNFRPRDVSVAEFQAALGDAIDRRRSQRGGPTGELHMRDTPSLRFGPNAVHARNGHADQDILFHDMNNRSVERQMQALAENAMVHNAALEMLKSDLHLLESAIRQQP